MRLVGAVVGIVLALGGAAPAEAVVGGFRAVDGQFPWAVRLSVGCDGALVAPRVVLTAAHCVDAVSGLSVVAGSVDRRAGVIARSTAIRRAAGYRPGSLRADWAVIQLDRGLDLPVLAVTRSGAADHGTFTVVGWGATHEGGRQQRYLRWTRVPFVGDAVCVDAYQDDGYLPSDMICAGSGGIDACQGDSGGPLVRRDDSGAWVEVGIVSWGYGCARPGYPGVYTQISAFTAAISAAVAALR